MRSKKLSLRPVNNNDIDLLTSWLNSDYILQWYHNPDEWLAEINGRHGVYSWIHHFIAIAEDIPIGFCQYYDCYNARDLEDWYSVTQPDGIFSIDYLIGNEDYLGKGYGKTIVKILTETIRREEQAKEIIVYPDANNHASIRVLVANGYVYDEQTKYYRKLLDWF